MGSIGPNYQVNDFNVVLILFLLFLMLEFETVRNVIIALFFASHAYIHGTFYQKTWFSLLHAGPLNGSPLLVASLQFSGLLFLTWLLWRRKTAFWRGIAFFGWCLLAGAAFYSVFSVYSRLEGFFHWVQVVEFCLLALLINAPPWIVIYILRRLGYRPFSVHDDASADSTS